MVILGEFLPHSPCNPSRDRHMGIFLRSDDTRLTPCGRGSIKKQHRILIDTDLIDMYV